MSIIFSLGIATTWLFLHIINLGDFKGITFATLGCILIYLYAFVIYRLFLHFIPLPEGEVIKGSQGELSAQINNLFYLLLFNTLIRTHFLPTPLMRLIYLALGARMGSNTYSVGSILDPPLTSFGANCIVGHDAVVFCHVIEGQNFALFPITVGNNVTIGAMAIIMPGVKISDGAIISAGAVVLKGTSIGPNEIWAGVPAKRIK